MNSNQRHPMKTYVRVAVPYYGNLVHPQKGIATLFFLAHIDPAGRQIRELQIRVWDVTHHPHLSQWLLEQEISGLICTKCKSPYLGHLQREGLWIHFGQGGDAEGMLSDWLDSYDLDELLSLVA